MPAGRWVLAGLTAKAAALLCGALLHIAFTGPDWTVLRPVALLLAVAAAAFPVPMMWAVIAHAVISRRRARIIMRVALATLVAGTIAVGATFAVTSFVERAHSVEQLSVSPSGRVYAATRAGIFVANPRRRTLRYLRYGWPGTPAAAVVADARNAMLVWADLGTNHLESRNAGRTWREVAGLPPSENQWSVARMVSTKGGVYVTSGWPPDDTLWVNRSGDAGDWEKRPLKLPKIEARGRVRVLPSRMAASSEHPGLVMLAVEYGVSGIEAGLETWRGALYRTRDFGETWERVSIPLLVEDDAGEQIDDIAIVPGSPEIVAVATWWGLLISSDEGRHWRRVKRPEGEHPRVAGAPTVPPTIYLLVVNRLYASEDLGLTWRDTRAMGSCIAISPANPRTIYTGSLGGGAYRSQDGGRTWHRLGYSFLPISFPGG